MRHVIGLGNPGSAYADTRHNVGFHVLDTLANAGGRRFIAVHPLYSACDLRVASQPVRLIKPMTFMNRSGVAVALELASLQFPCESILMVVDDMALPLGRLRLRSKGSAGGHNGMASLIAELGDERFPRLRMGIGSPEGVSVVSHVLSPFHTHERPVVDAMIQRGADAVQEWIEHGLDRAMSRYND